MASQIRASRELIEAIAVTAELCGRVMSEAAARVMCNDLAAFPEAQVIAALSRCRKEVRGPLTVQDVISRIDDGRPGAEEAWAMLPRSEVESCVWTDEMSKAYGVAASLMNDEVAARMAFKEVYSRLVADARNAGTPTRWTPSLGTDAASRGSVLERAVQLKRLTRAQADKLLAAPQGQPDFKALEMSAAKATDPEAARRQIASLKRLVGLTR